MVLPNYTYVKKGDVELPDEKPIISKSIGEKCTIDMAKEYGIYDDDNKWNNSIISENIVDKLEYYDDIRNTWHCGWEFLLRWSTKFIDEIICFNKY